MYPAMRKASRKSGGSKRILYERKRYEKSKQSKDGAIVGDADAINDAYSGFSIR